MPRRHGTPDPTRPDPTRPDPMTATATSCTARPPSKVCAPRSVWTCRRVAALKYHANEELCYGCVLEADASRVRVGCRARRTRRRAVGPGPHRELVKQVCGAGVSMTQSVALWVRRRSRRAGHREHPAAHLQHAYMTVVHNGRAEECLRAMATTLRR